MMTSARIAAFTDGVIAIIITIMVLELKVPDRGDLSALRETLPVLLAYVLSFVNVALYWNNHHHLFLTAERIDGRVLWANHFLLFWLSLMPFVIRWLDAATFGAGPTAAYGLVLFMSSLGWSLTERTIIACNADHPRLARAIGRDRKGKLSMLLYLVAIPTAFASTWAAIALYVATSMLWLVPDRRIARALAEGDAA
jgi:uncharacterized membrane protein